MVSNLNFKIVFKTLKHLFRKRKSFLAKDNDQSKISLKHQKLNEAMSTALSSTSEKPNIRFKKIIIKGSLMQQTEGLN